MSDAARKENNFSFAHGLLLSSVACLTVSYFPHHFTKGTILETIKYKMCVLIFSTTFVRNIFILRRLQRDITKNIRLFLCKVLVIPVRF
jgi:hypothetical protein